MFLYKRYLNESNVGFLLFSLVFLIPFSVDGFQNEVRIIVSDASKVLFEYRPAFPQLGTVEIKGENFTYIDLNNTGYLYEKGRPILPSKSLILGIPPSGPVTGKVVECKYEEMLVDQILPAPVTNRDAMGNVVGEEYIKDQTVYSKNAYFPEAPFELSQPSWLRHQRIVNVNLFPVRYNPVTGKILICKKMTVEIRFHRSTRGLYKQNASVSPAFYDLYRAALLNFNVAKNWINPVHHRLGKMLEFSGTWYKLAVENNAIYKLDYTTFMQIGYDSTLLNPHQVQIWYGGGRELPRDINARTPDLAEIPTFFHDENGDGQLGKNDYILFYGQGTSGWEYDAASHTYHHYQNHYTDVNIYWLAIGNGPAREMSVRDGRKRYQAASKIMDKSRERMFVEKEILNDEKSGIEWMWDRLSGTTVRKYHFHVSDVVEQDSVTLRVRMKGITEDNHKLLFYLNDQFIGQHILPYTLAQTIEMKTVGLLENGDNVLKIELQSPTGSDNEVYFDWFELEYWRSLVGEDATLHFSSSGVDDVVEFHIQGFSSTDVALFDVTDPYAVGKIEYGVSDSAIVFRDSLLTGAEHQYIANSPERFAMVTNITSVENPFAKLHRNENAADYVIITHKSLKGGALQHLAEHRSQSEYWPHQGSPKVKIVTTDEIYNEFSWGLFDPTAIRNFLKYSYENWSVVPSYVLLVGDAYYNMKRNNGAIYTTLVPTFEDELRATDDWFVCLDGDRTPDMFIGRLPVQGQEELGVVVNKIIKYDRKIPPGPWKNTLLLIADNEFAGGYSPDDYVFGRDTERLANDSVARSFDIQKLYMQQYSRNRFGRMPQVKEKLINILNRGVLYANFLGHGNLEVLTHEDIFYSPEDITYLSNADHLPLFFFGTCAVGQFDYDRKKSMAEELLLHPEGGCFAVIAGTRWNAHQITFEINRNFYRNILARPLSGSSQTIGQALLAAKLKSRYPDHRELLTLFGDPAQRLAIPKYTIDLSVSPDSIDGTKKVRLQGTVYRGETVASDFTGSLFVKLYDSFLKRYATNYSYAIPGRVVFADSFRVDNGNVDTDFFLRADTIAGGAAGRMVAYAWRPDFYGCENIVDASGAVDSLVVIADTLTAATVIDSIPPQVTMEINGIPLPETSESDIYTDTDFSLAVRVTDDFSGIYAGHEAGYEMSIQLDHSPDSTWNVSSDFVFDDNSHRSGSVRFRFTDLTPGQHSIQFSVWDNSLNRTFRDIRIVVNSKDLRLIDPLTFPNPAVGHTAFTFSLTHAADVTIKVYTVAGRLIRRFHASANRGFNRLPEDDWDCTDEEGAPLANGVYLYKIIANRLFSSFETEKQPQHVETIGRLLIMR